MVEADIGPLETGHRSCARSNDKRNNEVALAVDVATACWRSDPGYRPHRMRHEDPGSLRPPLIHAKVPPFQHLHKVLRGRWTRFMRSSGCLGLWKRANRHSGSTAADSRRFRQGGEIELRGPQDRYLILNTRAMSNAFRL